MDIYWVFLILAIVIALNSNKISIPINADKKWSIVILIIMAIINIIIIIRPLSLII